MEVTTLTLMHTKAQSNSPHAYEFQTFDSLTIAFVRESANSFCNPGRIKKEKIREKDFFRRKGEKGRKGANIRLPGQNKKRADTFYHLEKERPRYLPSP